MQLVLLLSDICEPLKWDFSIFYMYFGKYGKYVLLNNINVN